LNNLTNKFSTVQCSWIFTKGALQFSDAYNLHFQL